MPESTLQPLRGRHDEMTVLDGLLEGAERGVGGRALIEGEGGIGKSRLTEEACRRARERGFEVYVARSEHLERGRPLAALMRGLAALRLDLGELWTLGPEDAGRGRSVLVADSVIDVLESRALRRPLVLVVEDLHWADSDTIRFCANALRRTEDVPMVTIGTLRHGAGEEASEVGLLVERAEAEGTHVLRLRGLERAAIDEIVADLLGAVPGKTLLAEIDRAGGSPFYVIELVSALDAEGAIRMVEDHADTAESFMPPSLRLTILRRIGALPADTIEEIRLAAVLGSAFSVTDLSVVGGRSPLELLRILEPAIAGGFLHDVSERLVFRHDLVHAAIYEDIPLTMRRALHRQIADSFRSAGKPTFAIAVHLARSAEPGDVAVAEQLIGVAFSTDGISERLYLQERAIEIAPEGHDVRAEAVAGTVLSLAYTFRSAEAVERGETLLRQDLSRRDEHIIRYGLAKAHENLNNGDVAAGHWRWILAQSDPLAAPARRDAAAELSALALQAGDVDAAVELAESVLADDTPTDDPFALAAARTSLSMIASAQGRPGDAIAHGGASVETSDRVWEERGDVFLTRVVYGLSLADVDRFDEARETVLVAHRRAESSGRGNVLQHQLALAMILYVSGRWDEAMAELDGALSVVDVERRAAYYGLGIAARIHMHRGGFDEAERLISRGDALLASDGPGFGSDVLLWAKAVFAAASGRNDEALASWSSFGPRPDPSATSSVRGG